jgi:hypothetical protein
MKPIKWDSPEGAGRGGWGAAAPPARLPQHDNGSEELLREIAELKQEIAMKDAAFNALLMAKDAEIRRLHADLARSCAAAGGAVAAAAIERLSASAAGYSAAPRLARGMIPTMDLEWAITPISLSW